MTATLAADLVAKLRGERLHISDSRALTIPTLAGFRAAYDDYEHGLADRLATVPARDRYVFFAETHAYLPWAYELATQRPVLDAVESLLGTDLMIWDSRWFTKRPGDATYISWHQDGTYWSQPAEGLYGMDRLVAQFRRERCDAGRARNSQRWTDSSCRHL